MSTLKVDTITKADGTGSLSVPAESGTVVTTASPSLGRRNLIINGAMQVAQRGTSVSGRTSLNAYATVDRFFGNSNSVGSFECTDEQSTDAPDVFSFSRKLTFTVAQTTSSSTRNQVRYHPEGYDVAHLGWGTANAKTITLSFWVKSSVTGDMAVSFLNSGESHSYVSNYTINASNTWEYKTITVSGPTVGTWATGNTTGIRIAWDFGSGSNFDAPSEDTWNSGWYYKTSSSVRPAETLNATWQITGVQLEVGSVATPFEHRSYGEELALCQRYYWKYTGTSGNGYVAVGSGVYQSSTNFIAHIPYHVNMRSSPTMSIGTGLYISTVSFPTITSITTNYSNQFSGRIDFAAASSTAGYGGVLSLDNYAASFIAADAEL
jgi:hypothetical protein